MVAGGGFVRLVVGLDEVFRFGYELIEFGIFMRVLY